MTNATATVTEYMLAEVTPTGLQLLPQCGSWYTDRYYTNDHAGDVAVWYAADRVEAQAGGKYTVVAVSEFERGDDGIARNARTHGLVLVTRPDSAPRAARPARFGRVGEYLGRAAAAIRSANPVARAAAVAFAIGTWLVLLAVTPAWQFAEVVVRWMVAAVTF